MKQLVLKEHLEQVDDIDCKVVQRGELFYVYWEDGAILRRDCYEVHKELGPILMDCKQRYNINERWF